MRTVVAELTEEEYRNLRGFRRADTTLFHLSEPRYAGKMLADGVELAQEKKLMSGEWTVWGDPFEKYE